MPRRRTRSSCLALLLSALPFGVQADPWDGGDELPARSLPELRHGSSEMHDLAARPGSVADVDLSHLPQDPYTSWEVTLDGAPVRAGVVELQRLSTDGTQLLQSGVAPGIAGGRSRTLAWVNASASPATDLIRVFGADCGTACSADDVYRLRAYETTVAIPRFNNSGPQSTGLFLQNPGTTAHAGNAYFWSASGALVGTLPFVLAPKQQLVLATSSVAPGTSGSITIAHDAGYGGLTGKATTFDATTGSSSDSIGTPKPH